MTTNSAICASLTREDFETLSAVVMADPSDSPHDFLAACDGAGVLTLIASAQGLPAIPEEQLEDEFDELLDEAFDDVVIAGAFTYQTSTALKRVDPIAYRQAFVEQMDRSLVERGGRYFKVDEVCGLDRAEVLETLASHCVERFGLDDEVAEDLGSADTPRAFVSVLKRLYLANEAVSASAVVSQDERRRM